MRLRILTFLLLAGLAHSQTSVAPSGFGYDKLEGGTGVATGLSAPYSRNMQIIAAKRVGFAAGNIRELAFRRVAAPSDFSAYSRKLTVRLGYAARGVTPDAMPTAFDAVPSGGVAKMTKVFDGTIALPASKYANKLPPWSVVIKLAKSFAWDAKKGPLVIDMIGQTTSGVTRWIRDGRFVQSDARAGTTQSRGPGCPGSNQLALHVSLNPATTAIPGKKMRIYTWGAPLGATVALNVFGVKFRAPFPIKLDSAGMPGCKLYTNLAILVGIPLKKATSTFQSGETLWPLPNLKILAGARLVTQSFVFDRAANAAGITTSNGILIKLGKARTSVFSTQTLWSYMRGAKTGSQLSNYDYGAIWRISH